MPGRFFLTKPLAEVAQALGATLPAPAQEPKRENIAPGQDIIACVGDGIGCLRLARMRWGIIPVGRKNARGRPVLETIINARGETVFSKTAFSGTGRGLIPVEGWYEWTGKARRKTAWRIVPRDGHVLTFAAITDIWVAPGGQDVPQIAAVTCAPSPDVAAIHDRMGVIIAPGDRMAWLTGGQAEADDLIRPWPAGHLRVEEALGVDFNGP